MKRVPIVDLCGVYGPRQKCDDTEFNPAGRNSSDVIALLKKETTPRKYVDCVIAITQLYFDGLISEGTTLEKTNANEYERDTQKEILDALILAGKLSVGSFYRNEIMPFEEIKDVVTQYEQEIIGYCGKKIAKRQHLSVKCLKIQEFAYMLQREPDICETDTVVCMASGGFEPSFLAIDILEKESILPIRYSRQAKSDTFVKIPKNTPDGYMMSQINGKKVLIIEDMVS